jgi:hypothetical protein
VSTLLLLAAAAAEVDESEVSAGPIGLLIVLLMLIATALLIRNMNGRLKRLPREFPDPDSPAPDGSTPADAEPGRPPV